MSHSRFERLSAVFRGALEQTDSEREAYVRENLSDDADLCDEVLEMLAAASRPDELLDLSPGDEVAARHARAALSTPRTVGPFRIVRHIATGGMGAVYEAEQDRPRRRVALKVMHVVGDDDALRRRFEREGEILGALHHPGIAQVYDAGVVEGEAGAPLSYMALELVDGAPLDVHAAQERLDVRARVQLVVRVSDAIAHAHQMGVVHRDLKPANVLVDRTGQPKVLDFGIARRETGETLVTSAGALLGTLAYMAPEQTRGEPVDHRADVHGLGLLLFELLTGRLPYDVRDLPASEVIREITEAEPRSLAALDPSLRGDLETIVAKALEKDPARRYSTTEDFARDLVAWLEERPIEARPASALYRASKFARRNRVLVGASLALLATVTAGLLFERRAANEARLEAERATRTRDFLLEMVASADVHGRGIPGNASVRFRGLENDLSGRILAGLEVWDFEPETEGLLLLVAGQNLHGSNRTDEAVPVLRRAIEIWSADGRAPGPELVRAMTALGMALEREGIHHNDRRFHAEATHVMAEALQIARRHLDALSVESRVAEFLAANITRRFGTPREVLEAHDAVLESCRSAEVEYELLDHAIEVSRIWPLRQVEGADAALEVAMRDIRERRGSGQAVLVTDAWMAQNAAGMLRAASRYEEALQEERWALERLEALHGPGGRVEHEMSVVAFDLQQLGRLAEADELLSEARRRLEQRVPTGHAAAAGLGVAHADLLLEMGDRERAAEALTQATAYLSTPEPIHWLNPRSNLLERTCAVLLELGRGDEAVSLLELEVDRLERTDEIEPFPSRTELAHGFGLRGNQIAWWCRDRSADVVTVGLRIARWADATLRGSVPAGDRSRVMVADTLGVLLTLQGSAQEAVQELERAVVEAGPDPSPLRAECRVHLGQALHAAGRSDEALAALDAAVAELVALGQQSSALGHEARQAREALGAD